MTKEQFERYSFICRQIRKLSQPVQDTVMTSSKDFPWGPHITAISGQQDSELLRQYKAEKQEIEAFINAHEDEEKELLQAVAKYGTRWDIVRRDIESWKSPDAVRKKYERLFKRD